MESIVQESKVAKFVQGLTPTTLPFNAAALQTAKDTLQNEDFPTTRQERWKYTRVAKITNKEYKEAKAQLQELALPLSDAINLVFVNGFFNSELSTSEIPAGLNIQNCASATMASDFLAGAVASDTDAFTAINTAYAQDGAFVLIAAKAVIEKPIQLVYVITGENSIANIRNVIVADKFSQAKIAQVYLAQDAKETLTTSITEVFVAENAFLSIDKIQNENESTFTFATEHVKQEKSSNFTINTMTLNGAWVRNNLNIDVDGQNCETHLNAAYILKGNQHVDNHTTVDHLQANCESNELYKGVVDENATAVFNGKVFVRKDAQKINAYQSNGNVLLSDSAAVNSKPELEIYADDVKCSHGSTTGQLDEEAIYYLRARGISEKSAKALMVTAFIDDVLEKIAIEELLDYVHGELTARFDWNYGTL